MGVCTGAIMFALWIAVRELRNIARRLGPGAAAGARRSRGQAGAAAGDAGAAAPGDQPARAAGEPQTTAGAVRRAATVAG